MHIPKLCRQKLRNRAFVREGGKKIYLGKWGEPATEAAYRAYINELTAPVPRLPANEEATITDLALAFLKAHRNYYVKDGRQTGQLARFKAALEFPLRLYPNDTVSEFGPRKLIAVRNAMEESGRYARTYINTLINCIRRVFRWGVENELVPSDALTALTTVSPLKRRRSIARETEPIGPVDPDVVAKTIEFLPPTIADMVRIQRYTGMRPGEVCAMRAGDFSTNARGVMTYTLRTDKTDHRRTAREKRVVYLGPKVERIVTGYLVECADDKDAFLFTPKNALEERRFIRMNGARRVRPRKPRKLNPCFDRCSYARAITRAADAAGVPHWAPNQLRHLFASEIREKYGLEAAQIMLGHSKADVTQIYAERDFKKMEEIANKEG